LFSMKFLINVVDGFQLPGLLHSTFSFCHFPHYLFCSYEIIVFSYCLEL
jgi:hypothetical protein